MKKVAIAWYGAEGRASYKYYADRGDDVTIVTPKFSPDFPAPEGAQVITGDDAFDRLGGFDIVVRSSGVRPDSLKTDGRVWSATNEFMARCPAPVIGVTGTKGKGTTSSLIASVLRSAGYTVHLVGNIGVPALSALPSIKSDHVVVYELSSFQLWDIRRSPHVSVVLMIEPDHLDVHRDMDEYIAAKSRIVKYQTEEDICVYHPTNDISRQIAEASQGTTKRYATPEDGGVYVESNTFFVRGEAIAGTSALQLPGQHNIENACAALTAALEFTRDYDRMESGLREFTGLPHRLKLVREVDGVRYYDDSYSSAPGATMAAIRAFDEPSVLICGGYDRQLDFGELAQTIAESKYLQRTILYGATRERIAEALSAVGYEDYELVDSDDLGRVVAAATHAADGRGVVIFSPGCPSFDMFANFTERGEKFIDIVEGLARG